MHLTALYAPPARAADLYKFALHFSQFANEILYPLSNMVLKAATLENFLPDWGLGWRELQLIPRFNMDLNQLGDLNLPTRSIRIGTNPNNNKIITVNDRRQCNMALANGNLLQVIKSEWFRFFELPREGFDMTDMDTYNSFNVWHYGFFPGMHKHFTHRRGQRVVVEYRHNNSPYFEDWHASEPRVIRNQDEGPLLMSINSQLNTGLHSFMGTDTSININMIGQILK